MSDGRKKNADTTIAVPNGDRLALGDFAERRGLKLRHAPGLLIEIAKLATPEQEAEAIRRFASRRPRRRELVQR